MIKKWDIIIIVLLMIMSFIPEFILGANLKAEHNNVYAEITISGKLYKNINLSSHKGEEIIEVNTKNGSNKIIIKDDKIGIYDADCPDKICMKPEFISSVGENLVCLPHRLMIEIKGVKEEEDMIISH
ncbi:NusG domain II-containing protein [Clostridium septicum]|uniref:NusG domain II-containing protein n=1 Tax=Clostridium septicum TaxID=1504 RepID=A0A9N7JMH2_CLOSE|nr:NusG domain II-containing protein [Clostridium septicum]AYE34704.1 NusG domain II-containing protein [Clostridium septicum]MDU1312788.1 NusG domain II-containing protein [Clostridium septicum]QAS60105.1 NusG domain II-containing protein [Clostridium septicum]UEC20650.1 NusG domain II-containing protein [Clostridium septicum]USS01299.1 NusG domain II-containing protein [Clostridium septicum]